MGQQFQYPILDRLSGTIRLLVLSQDLHPEDGRLRCRLVVSSIDAKYEALSYSWGTPDSFDLKIWVNDCHFAVRQNLYCALTALRTTGDRYLWIDALCINQDDSNEKGHQVGMMDLIYEKAEQVLVWLGCSEGFCTKAMSIENSSGPSIKSRFEEETLPAFELLKLVVEGRNKNPRGFDEWVHFRPFFRLKWVAHWKQLAEIFTVPYWKRLWIVQEFGLATKMQILYGTSSCDGLVFFHFRELLYRLPVWPVPVEQQALAHATATVPDIGTSLQRILNSQAMFTPARVKEIIYGNGFESLLKKCEEQLCAERRDKVYAILRLPHDVKNGDIPIDYSISIPELYKRTLDWSCKREGNSSMDRFSRTVLRALLGPLSFEDSPVDMFNADSAETEDPLWWSIGEYDINALLVGQIRILPLNVPWVDATLEHVQTPNMLLKDTPEELKTMDQSTLVSSLENLWEVDPTSTIALGGRKRSTGANLFTFKSGSETRIGLGPDCLQDSDLLCRLGRTHAVTICRYENSDYHFVGRAAISSGHAGKKKADLTKHHPLWPPPELDIYNGPVDDPTLVRNWRVSLELLQALTCPLRWRSL
ncbi:Heterokaryon incompatibility protein (HET) domain containing protein [Hyaloscypha variabilis]